MINVDKETALVVSLNEFLDKLQFQYFSLYSYFCEERRTRLYFLVVTHPDYGVSSFTS